jgi:mRNA interferase RelE/StbE
MRIEITKRGKKDIDKLTSQIKKRCADAIRVLAENPFRGEPLKGEFHGLRRYRVGDFRIIYEIDIESELMTIHAIGHRRDVYR